MERKVIMSNKTYGSNEYKIGHYYLVTVIIQKGCADIVQNYPFCI